MPVPQLSSARLQIPSLRWWIIALLFIATLINFLDRLTISVLATPICESLHLTNEQFAHINIWFLAAYTLSQGLSGKIYDRIGVKKGFAGSITLWSAAAMAHAFAVGLNSLSVLRAFLGLGEAGNWPGATKIIAEWFPIRERAFAMSIVNSGTSLGSVIAPPLIVWLNFAFGWQAAFLVTGALGFLWLGVWLNFYQPFAAHSALTEEERVLIESDQPVSSAADSEETTPWTWWQLAKYRQVWAILLARLFVDPIWWLYILWLPKYLGSERHLSLEQAGWGTSVPFLAAALGGFLGGGGSGFFIRRGWTVNRARKTFILIGCVFMPAGIFAPYCSNVVSALACISLVTFGFQFWVNNVQTLPSDIFPKHAVATVAGIGGFGAGIGSIIFTQTTGWVVDHFSYTPIIITAGLLAPLGTLILLTLLGEVKRV